jgi:chromosome segregation ATPase
VKLEKEVQTKREQMEGDLKIREKAVVEQEAELNELKKKVTAFPKEMEAALVKAVKETTERINLDAKNREEIQKREFAGEKNVLTTRIESLEKTVKEQSERIIKLNQQLEKAYQQVQDIAVKTIEGSSDAKSLANLQQWVSEQMKKPQEK